jgi:hypothetical protein
MYSTASTEHQPTSNLKTTISLPRPDPITSNFQVTRTAQIRGRLGVHYATPLKNDRAATLSARKLLASVFVCDHLSRAINHRWERGPEIRRITGRSIVPPELRRK